MSRNIYKTVRQKKKRADQSRITQPLIGSLFQWKSSPNECDSGEREEQDSWPAHLRPNPEPVALGVECPLSSTRSVTIKGKNAFKISEANPAPGRSVDHRPSVAKNEPAIVRSHRPFASSWNMKAFDCFSAE